MLVPYLALQIIWLIWILVTSGPWKAASVALYPQFSLRYLAALFTWRCVLPLLIRVKRVLAVALALFSLSRLVGGLDNLLGLQRAIGFFIYFLMDYYSTGASVARFVRKIPLDVALAAPCLRFLVLWSCFVSGWLGYETVFCTLTHGRSIWAFSSVWEGFVAYVVVLAASIVVSSCVLRLLPPVKGSGVLSRVGSNTMPLYAAQGFVVQATCCGLTCAGLADCPETIIVAMLIVMTLVTTILFTSEIARRGYVTLWRGARLLVLKE